MPIRPNAGIAVRGPLREPPETTSATALLPHYWGHDHHNDIFIFSGDHQTRNPDAANLFR